MAAGQGLLVFFGLMVSLAATPVLAQGVDAGRLEYENQCSVCHGAKARGDGPLAGTLSEKVPDLSVLKKNNNGVMPLRTMYEIIEGQTFVRAHGQRDMPIWSKRLADQAQFFLGAKASEAQKQTFVRERILALIGYIGTLQAD